MLLHLLAVGDVVAQGGLDCLHRHLRRLKKEHDVHFTVVNGENAAGLGLLPSMPRNSLTQGRTSSPWATTPGENGRSRTIWRTTPIFSARPTSPPTFPGGALGSMRAPRACGWGC